jgi:hypothetical protein
MWVGAAFKYDLTESEIVVRDMLANPATYTYGQVLTSGTTDGTYGGSVYTMGAGVGSYAGVSNEGGVANAGKVLAGTFAAGTLETLKVIVNPFAVYSIEYDLASVLTWLAVTDTTITLTCGSGTGNQDFGGGWAWSYNTGELDFIVSSSGGSTTSTFVTVTGTDTTSTTGILIYPQGQMYVRLTSAATRIAAHTDIGILKTSAVGAVIMGNSIVSNTYGEEKLLPANNSTANQIGGYYITNPSTTPGNRMNQAKRFMRTQTTAGKTMDKAKAYASVLFTDSIYTQPTAVWAHI